MMINHATSSAKATLSVQSEFTFCLHVLLLLHNLSLKIGPLTQRRNQKPFGGKLLTTGNYLREPNSLTSLTPLTRLTLCWTPLNPLTPLDPLGPR